MPTPGELVFAVRREDEDAETGSQLQAVNYSLARSVAQRMLKRNAVASNYAGGQRGLGEFAARWGRDKMENRNRRAEALKLSRRPSVDL